MVITRLLQETKPWSINLTFINIFFSSQVTTTSFQALALHTDHQNVGPQWPIHRRQSIHTPLGVGKTDIHDQTSQENTKFPTQRRHLWPDAITNRFSNIMEFSTTRYRRKQISNTMESFTTKCRRQQISNTMESSTTKCRRQQISNTMEPSTTKCRRKQIIHTSMCRQANLPRTQYRKKPYQVVCGIVKSRITRAWISFTEILFTVYCIKFKLLIWFCT